MGTLFSLSNVSVVRDGRTILGPLDLSVDIGESIAVIGRNGSGKTTLSKLLRKEISPYYDELAHSSLTVLGKGDWDIFDLRREIVSVSTDDERFFSDGKIVAEVIMSGMFGSDGIYPTYDITKEMVDRMEEVAEITGLNGRLRETFGTLSQGERRSVMIARALMPCPKAMILDEPTNSLDPVASALFISMIEGLIESGTSVVMITHKLEDIPRGIGRVIGMKDGIKAADGRKEDILVSETLSEIYVCPSEVISDGGLYSLKVDVTKV